MRKLSSILAVAVSLPFCPGLFAQGTLGSLSITRYNYVSEQRMTRNIFYVTYTVDLANNGGARTAVTATVTSSTPNVQILPGQNTVHFGPIPANGQVTSLDTFTISVDRSVPFDFSSLQWSIMNPVANAGPNQTVTVGSSVILNGSASSNPSGVGLLTYNWSLQSLPQGSHATISNANSVTASFIKDTPGVYVVQLTVSNGIGQDTSTATINPLNSPPVANAGPDQSVGINRFVTLNGSASTDIDGDPLTFTWRFVSVPQGSAAQLSNTHILFPTFLVDKPGTYITQLIVNDGKVDSLPSTVNVTTVNTPPVANAGLGQSVAVNALVQLNGAASTDVDGNPLTYRWSLITIPSGSTAVLSSTSAVNPTFTADRPGTYIAQLIVNDGIVDSQPSTVSISTNALQPPTANAGANQTASHGVPVTLNGSGTDPQNLPLTFLWAKILSPAGSTATLSANNIAHPTFTADLTGQYVFQLITDNGFLHSAPSTVTITTTNTAPVADAGANQGIFVGGTVSLDGSKSHDADNDPLTYSWSFLNRPAGSAATLSNPAAKSPTFITDVAGSYVVQLIVNDGFTNSNPATVTITASTMTITLAPNPLNIPLSGGPGIFTVTVNPPAGPNGLPLSFSGFNPSVVSLPPNAAVPANSTGVNIMATPVGAGSTGLTVGGAGYQSGTMTINVTSPSISVSLNQGSVGIGNSIGGTVTLNQAAASNVTVTLSASPSGLVSFNPATVTIPQGGTTGTFQVTGVAAGNPTITASATGYASGTAGVIVTNLGTITLASGVSVPAGQSTTLNVSLGAAAAANVTVTLISGDTSILTVPPSVTILQGQTTVPIQVTGVGIGSTTVSASATGFNGDTKTVKSTATLSFSTQVVSVGAGGVSSINLLLSAPAPTGGLSIGLVSDHTQFATVPPNVTILAGTTSVQVDVTGVAAGSATITASTTNPNVTGAQTSVTVTSNSGINVPASVNVSPGATAPYPVSLSTPSQFNTFIDLKVLDTSKATISPSQIVILAGQTQPGVPVVVTGVAPGTTSITATPTGASTPAGTSALTVAYTLSINPPTLQIMGNNVQGTLTLNLSAAAPAGGIVFNLSSTNPNVVAPFPTVTLPAGSSSIGFIVTSKSAGTADIHASATNVPDAKATVTVVPPGSINLSGPVNINLDQSAALTIGLSAPAPAPLTVTLTSSDPNTLSVSPATVSIAQGNTAPSTQPQITGNNNGTATIIASAPGFTSSTPLSVNVNATVTWLGQPLTIVGVGNTGQVSLRLNGFPADQNQIVGVTVNLSSSDTSVVTIQPLTTYFWDGSTAPAHLLQVTAVGPGTAILHASGTNIPDATFSVTVIGGLGITTASLPPGTINTAYTASVAGIGGTTPYSWSATGLPAGLTINPVSGQITGTPTASGPFTVAVTLTDASTPTHLTATRNLSLTIAATLSITTGSLGNGVVGVPYSAPVAASGGTTPYVWSATGLPNGLTIDSVSGQITGTPTAAGTSTVAITVTDATTPTHLTASKSLSLTIAPGVLITTASLPNGQVGQPYNAPNTASGGLTPYTWSASGLPPGLTIDSTTGQITGTPTSGGPNNVTVTVTDATTPTHLTNSKSFSVNIAVGVSITTTSLASGFVNTPYSSPVAATGGVTPYTWSATGLPAGLTIDPTTGQLSGTPTTAGTSNVAITVTDSTPTTHLTATKTLPLIVNAGVSITTTSLPVGVQGVAYTGNLAASGGATPYTWSASGLPQALTIDPLTGQIGGAPVVTGTFNNVVITVTDATNPTHLTASKTFSLTVNAGLVISTTSLPNGFTGISYSTTLAATGGTPGYTWAAGGLPAGLTIDSTTGIISGTPTAAGTASVTISATDSTLPAHLVKAATLSLTIGLGPSIGTASLPTGFVNMAYNAPVTGSGGTTPYTWSASGLPANLTIDPTTGTISGTPTATSAGNVTITLTDSSSPTHLTASKTLALTINPGVSITTTSLNAGFVGSTYSSPLAATGGTPGYTWTASGLPAGLTIDPNTGTISGTPTGTGNSSVTITATDSTTPTHLTASKTLTLTVNPALSITTTSLPAGFTGFAYSGPLAASGGTPNYTWSATGLPAGLTIDPTTGAISGTPTNTGTFNVTITVTDSTTPTHLSVSKPLPLTVNQGLSISTTSLPTGFTGSAYTGPVAAAGGTPNYSWSATGLPAGLTISTTTGAITGTPTTAGTSTVNITVTDSTSPTHLTASKSLSLIVNQGLSITTTALNPAFVAVPYSSPLAATGGTPNYTWSATGLPAGLTIDPNTGILSGTPTAISSGNVTITVTDSTTPTHLTASATLSLTVSTGVGISTGSLPIGFTGVLYTATLTAVNGNTPYAWSSTALPAGLTLDPTTGIISGTPTATGTTNVTFTVTDNTSPTHLTASKTLPLTINAPPSIGTASLPIGFTGVAYSAPNTASGGTTPYTWSATGLSAGLTIDPNTGTISGTPTATNAGNVTITLTDSTPGTHLTASKTLALTINAGLSCSTTSLPTGFTGTAYSGPISCSGGTTPYTFSATGLPAGLTIDALTGTISGTPTATSTGNVTVTVTDSTLPTHQTVSKTLSLTINLGLSITTTALPVGFTGTPYAGPVIATGGTTPYTFTATGLPAGLTIDPVNGTISGTPTATNAGNVTITVTDVTSPTHLTASKTLALTVNQGVSIATTSLPNGFTLNPYNFTLSATGGTPSYTWSATGLPAGLTLDSTTGVISGTPTATGTSPVNITVTDATPGTHLTASKTLSITVNTGLSITTTALATGYTLNAYSFTMNAAGGTPSYTWAATGLPAGLTIDTTTGIISGTPTATGTSTVTITVTDTSVVPPNQTHLTASKTLPLTVNAGLAITTSALANGFTGFGYTATLAATGGTTPYTWSASSLPAGLTIDPTTGVISGTPTAVGTSNVAITVTDVTSPTHLTASVTLPLVINAGPSINTASLGNGSVGTAFNATLNATGGTTPYTWSATGLPTGLTIDATTGAISGTPTSPGAFNNVVVTVTDATTPTHLTASKTFQVTIAGLTITTTSLAVGTQQAPYSSPLAATGGKLPLTWTASGLPSGLTIDPTTGLISGNTNIPSINKFISIDVTDSSASPQHASTILGLTINPLPLTITTTDPLTPGTITVPYSANLSATGGFTPYSWSLPGLPAGLTLNPQTGVISGTPTVVGAFTLTATVTDSSPTPASVQKTLHLNIQNTVSQGLITVSNVTVGVNLQKPITITLSPTPLTDTNITITSSSPGLVLMGTSANAGAAQISATVTAGTGSLSTFVKALASSGTATITCSVQGYADATGTVTLANAGFVIAANGNIGGSVTTAPNNSTLLTVSSYLLNASGQFVESQQVRPGANVQVPISSSNLAVGDVPASVVTIPAGSDNTTISYTPTATGATTISVQSQFPFSTPVSGSAIAFNVLPGGIVAPTNITIGKNLQVPARAGLTAPASVDTPMTIQSSDPSRLKFATTATGPGSASIQVTIQQGFTNSAPFFVRAYDSTGSIPYTLSAPGFAPVTVSMPLAPSGFLINTPQGFGVNFGTTPAFDATLDIYTARYNGSSPVELQALAGDLSINVPVTSSATGVGTITSSPVPIAGGASFGETFFHPGNTAGNTQITAALAGYSSNSVTATVTIPKVNIGDMTIGNHLQDIGSFFLTAPAGPAGLDVTITSSGPLKFSLDPTAAGSTSITIHLNQNGFSGTFYVYALASSGSATYTASAPGYITGTATVTFAQSGIILIGPGACTSPSCTVNLSNGAASMTINTVALDFVGTPAIFQNLAGGSSLAVTLQNSNNTVGTLSSTSVSISPNTGSSGFTFTPKVAGQSSVSVVQPSGWNTPNSHTAVNITVQ